MRNRLFLVVAVLLLLLASPASSFAVSWGPAGPAPQDVGNAQNVLSTNRPDLLTEQWGFGGDPIIGWVVGTAWSANSGVNVTTRLPWGTCVDFDPRASSVFGSHRTMIDTGTHKRVLMNEHGWGSGLKYTVYWSFCDP